MHIPAHGDGRPSADQHAVDYPARLFAPALVEQGGAVPYAAERGFDICRVDHERDLTRVHELVHYPLPGIVQLLGSLWFRGLGYLGLSELIERRAHAGVVG